MYIYIYIYIRAKLRHLFRGETDSLFPCCDLYVYIKEKNRKCIYIRARESSFLVLFFFVDLNTLNKHARRQPEMTLRNNPVYSIREWKKRNFRPISISISNCLLLLIRILSCVCAFFFYFSNWASYLRVYTRWQ